MVCSDKAVDHFSNSGGEGLRAHSGLSQWNVPDALRTTIFNRCWVLIHAGPPPTKVRGAGVRPPSLDRGDARRNAEDHPKRAGKCRHPNVGLGVSTQ